MRSPSGSFSDRASCAAVGRPRRRFLYVTAQSASIFRLQSVSCDSECDSATIRTSHRQVTTWVLLQAFRVFGSAVEPRGLFASPAELTPTSSSDRPTSKDAPRMRQRPTPFPAASASFSAPTVLDSGDRRVLHPPPRTRVERNDSQRRFQDPNHTVAMHAQQPIVWVPGLRRGVTKLDDLDSTFVTDLIRAVLLAQSDRFEEARPLARAAEEHARESGNAAACEIAEIEAACRRGRSSSTSYTNQRTPATRWAPAWRAPTMRRCESWTTYPEIEKGRSAK